jgi:hypothetical protein
MGFGSSLLFLGCFNKPFNKLVAFVLICSCACTLTASFVAGITACVVSVGFFVF